MPEQADENPIGTSMFSVMKVLIPHIPTLLFRVPGTLFHIKRMAKRGGSVFQKELILQGINPEIAQKLTESYLETSNLKTYIGLFR